MSKRILLLVSLLLAVSCGTVGDTLGSLGGILGSTSQSDPSDVRGFVSTVDTNAQRIDLDVKTVNNLRQDVRGQSIYYDAQTVVQYQGKQYRVDQLQRGDEVSITGSNRNNRYVADRITVVHDVNQ